MDGISIDNDNMIDQIDTKNSNIISQEYEWGL